MIHKEYLRLGTCSFGIPTLCGKVLNILYTSALESTVWNHAVSGSLYAQGKCQGILAVTPMQERAGGPAGNYVTGPFFIVI